MSGDGKTIYRVYLQGLSATERTIFGGVIRLAEHGGTHFQIESAPDKTDIFILDGLDQRSLDFGKSDLQIAQRAIWIDPPAHLKPSRQFRRPLHWGALLQLMERIIGRNREPVAEVAKPRSAGLRLEQLCRLGEGVLRLHLGIAAEFIVNDVRTEFKSRGSTDEVVAPEIFLTALRSQFPDNVDAKKVLNEVSAAIFKAQRG